MFFSDSLEGALSCKRALLLTDGNFWKTCSLMLEHKKPTCEFPGSVCVNMMDYIDSSRFGLPIYPIHRL